MPDQPDGFPILSGDCLAVMRTLPSDQFDAIVTDPPFGIGKDYMGERENAQTAADYWTWFEPRYAEMLRLVKPGGMVAMWQSRLYLRHCWDWFGDEIHIYVSAKNFVQIRPKA